MRQVATGGEMLGATRLESRAKSKRQQQKPAAVFAEIERPHFLPERDVTKPDVAHFFDEVHANLSERV